MNPADVHADQPYFDTQERHVGVDPILPGDHRLDATQYPAVAGDPNLLNGQTPCDAQLTHAVEHQTPQPTKGAAASNAPSSAGDQAGSDHSIGVSHTAAVAASLSSPPATYAATPITCPPGVTNPTPPEPAIHHPMPIENTLILANSLLAIAADILDDLESVRIASENRLRHIIRTVTNGEPGSPFLPALLNHPDVIRPLAMVKRLRCNTDFLLKELGLPRTPQHLDCCMEHDAERNLTTKLKEHPLGPWIKSAHGVGDKQGARLLAAIGDPYIRPELRHADGRLELARPRRLTELYAYCGYHVLPVSQQRPDFQDRHANGDLTSARHAVCDTQLSVAGGSKHPTDHDTIDTHLSDVGGNGGNPDHAVGGIQVSTVGVAATRMRGRHINWNPTARMRCRLIAESIMKAGGPYRVIYDEGRAKYADAVHRVECRRCGPAGKPALPGSSLSKGHQMARALRLVTKRVLRDLWREAKRLHEEQGM